VLRRPGRTVGHGPWGGPPALDPAKPLRPELRTRADRAISFSGMPVFRRLGAPASGCLALGRIAYPADGPIGESAYAEPDSGGRQGLRAVRRSFAPDSTALRMAMWDKSRAVLRIFGRL